MHFKQVDVTPEVELQFEELLLNEEVVEVAGSELLHAANDVVGTLEEKELLERLDTLDTPLVDSIEEMKNSVDCSNPFKRMVEE